MAKDFFPTNIEWKEQKMQRENQIKAEINVMIKQINHLEEQKWIYIQSKEDTSQVSKELTDARKNIIKSKEALEKAYKGKSAIMCNEKMEKDINKINESLRILNNTIIPEIDKNIKKIEREIEERKNRIKRLEFELYSLNR